MNNKLKLSHLIFYGLPGFPLAMLGLPLFIYLPNFYNQNLGLSLSAVGLVLLLARSFDVITDPIIGYLNDKYPQLKPMVWRRKIFILLGVPLLIVGLNFLLKPVTEVTSGYLFLWSFITYLGWTLINIPWLSIGAEMSHNYHEKSSLASSREIFSAIGTVFVISIPVILSIQTDLKATLALIANLLTIFIPIALIPMLWKISLADQTRHTENFKPVKFSFKAFINKNIIIAKMPAIKKLLPAYFINSVANALPATLFILYVTHVLQSPDKIGVLLITYFLSAILGIPLWLYIARKNDKHTSWRYALYGSIFSFMWVPLIGPGDITGFLIVCFACGFCLGADVVMPSSIQADIAQKMSNQNGFDFKDNSVLDKDQTDSISTNSTSLLFGLWGMLTKLSLALAIGIAFPILDLIGLQINGPTSSTTSVSGSITLIILYAFIPILLKVWVILQLTNFKFDQHYFQSTPYSGKNFEQTTSPVSPKVNSQPGNYHDI